VVEVLGDHGSGGECAEAYAAAELECARPGYNTVIGEFTE
jgi:hypothetical protein